MASIDRRKTATGENRWEVRYRAPDGRERSRTFRTRRDAEKYANTAEADKARGSWIDPRDAALTFGEVADRWLASNRAKRASTLATDDVMLRVHILPTLDERKVGSVTRTDVQALVNAWSAGSAPRTVRRRFGVLTSVLTFAAESDWIGRSPCRGVKLPQVTTTRARHLEPEQVSAIAAGTPSEYEPMVWLGAILGLRWSEVAGLRVSRLDLLRRSVTIAEALTRDGSGRPVFAPPKSNAGSRTLAIPTQLADRLAQHLASIGLTAADGDELVFRSPGGGPLRYANWRRRVWLPATAQAGCEGAGFHDLRRANATGLVLAGVDLKTAQTRLGHSDPRLTIAVYAQATSDADRAAADAMGAHFSEGSRDIRGMVDSSS